MFCRCDIWIGGVAHLNIYIRAGTESAHNLICIK
jgi:hypothetical protein